MSLRMGLQCHRESHAANVLLSLNACGPFPRSGEDKHRFLHVIISWRSVRLYSERWRTLPHSTAYVALTVIKFDPFSSAFMLDGRAITSYLIKCLQMSVIKLTNNPVERPR